ncbi:MAG: RelA/SpoT family protein [Bacteroidales bacterium]
MNIHDERLVLIESYRGVYSDLEISEIEEALEYADMHSESRGRQYNNLSVAHIALVEFGLGAPSVVAALLLNCDEKKERLKEQFGEHVFSLLSGIRRIEDVSAENISINADKIRKLLMVLAGDARVVLLYLAVKLDEIRSLAMLSAAAQQNLVEEISAIYAPMAHRFGLYNINSEMLDGALSHTHSEDYKFIENKLDELEEEIERFTARFVEPIEDKLKSKGLQIKMKARTKSIHSIWTKMQRGREFDDIYDLFAIRIILDVPLEDEKAACWQVFSFVTEEYQSNPKRMKDWVSHPKENGYQSLHATVMGPDREWIEVQIRTKRMDEIAEKGLAAHWRYKGGTDSGKLDAWLGNIREIIENPNMDIGDFIEDMKTDVYDDHIYVFTPKGDLVELSAGASLLDFAYAVHSKVGDSCSGGKINGKYVSLKTKLTSGDLVSVDTSANQRPTASWLDFVVTSKAKSRIKVALNEQRKQNAAHGKEIVERKFKHWKLEFSDSNIQNMLKEFKYKLAVDFFADVFAGKIDTLAIKSKFKSEDTSAIENVKELLSPKELRSMEFDTGESLIIDKNLSKVSYALSKCCNPIYGDNIFAFISIGEGIKIHRRECPNAKYLFEKFPYRILNARWRDNEDSYTFQTTLSISGDDRFGLINDISNVVSNKVGVQVRHINFDTDVDRFHGELKLVVSGTNQLSGIIKQLSQLKGVDSVRRQS